MPNNLFSFYSERRVRLTHFLVITTRKVVRCTPMTHIQDFESSSLSIESIASTTLFIDLFLFYFCFHFYIFVIVFCLFLFLSLHLVPLDLPHHDIQPTKPSYPSVCANNSRVEVIYLSFPSPPDFLKGIQVSSCHDQPWNTFSARNEYSGSSAALKIGG